MAVGEIANFYVGHGVKPVINDKETETPATPFKFY